MCYHQQNKRSLLCGFFRSGIRREDFFLIRDMLERNRCLIAAELEHARSLDEAGELMHHRPYGLVLFEHNAGDAEAVRLVTDFLHAGRSVPNCLAKSRLDGATLLRTMHNTVALHNLQLDQQSAEESLRKLSRAVEQSADTVMIPDGQGVIEYVNPAFEALTQTFHAAATVVQDPQNLGRREGCSTRQLVEVELALGIMTAVRSMLPSARCALPLLLLYLHPGKVPAALFLAIFCGSVVYCILQVIAAIRYLQVQPPHLEIAEPISILKPLAGLDLDLESNLRTFFEQDYPVFEILFAVRTETDPAVQVVLRLQQEYSTIPSRLVITGEPPYPNAKVFSLERMLSAAANDLVVMSDSDIRVTPDLLRAAAAEFQDPHLGVATCPYRAVPGPSFWSRLEATGMNTDFWGGALVARMLEGMRFAVGPTIIARRRVLQSIGGFSRLKDYLAEDFVMGQFAADAGHGVILSSYVIEHHIGSATFLDNISHRIRWARSTRRSRPAGYIGQLFTMPLPLALIAWAFSPAWWPILLFALVVRALAAYAVSARVLHAKLNWVLLPIEDVIGFCFWIAGFFGNTISWRGRRFRLFADGRFQLITSAKRG